MFKKLGSMRPVACFMLSLALWYDFSLFKENPIVSVSFVVVSLIVVFILHPTFLQLNWVKQAGVVSFVTLVTFLALPIIGGSKVGLLVVSVLISVLTIFPYKEKELYASPKELTEEVTEQLKGSFEEEGEFTTETEVDLVSTIHTESVPKEVIEAQNEERKEIGEQPRRLPDKQNIQYKEEINSLHEATLAYMNNSPHKELLTKKSLEMEVPTFLRVHQEELKQLLEDKTADPECVPYLENWEQLKVRLGDARSDSRNEGHVKP